MKEQSTANDLFRDRSPTVVALDNLIRRKLRVSDPNDPTEVAGALKKLYRADKEAMEREAGGLPFLPMALPSAAPVAATSSQAEVDQAMSDVERDLTALSTNSLLKDIQPELNGWGSAIRAAMADGINAARTALDPRQRDLAFSMRRLLGDYARMARYVGALTPNLNIYYRRLAQSLDEVASVLLVLMGEALANIGFSGGRFLLQAPVSELQERRDAVVAALRNLVGSVQEAYGSDQWPRGLEAYRQFLKRLEDSGQSDLRALFQENTLARMMDDLIDRAAGSTADGLRALGATAQLGLESIRRLITFGRRLVEPESPPLTSFLIALQLFADVFSSGANGYRLMYVARPPILFYGLYGFGGPDKASRCLLNLTILRGQLADLLDCFLACDCSQDIVRCQILLDKVLYDLDRAIDLYVRGTKAEGDGEPENRTAGFGYLVKMVAAEVQKKCSIKAAMVSGSLTLIQQELLRTRINEERLFTLGEPDLPTSGQYKFSVNVVTKHKKYDISDIDGFPDASNPKVTFDNLWQEFDTAINDMLTKIGSIVPPTTKILAIEKPSEMLEIEAIRKDIVQELCMQSDAEAQWESLLHTMAPSCFRFDGFLTPTSDIIEQAINIVDQTVLGCRKSEITIPPTLETSLAGFSYLRRSKGD